MVRLSARGDSEVWPGGLHSVLKRVYSNRGVTSPEALDRTLSQLLPASQLYGSGEAADLLFKVMEQGGSILIIADFDADGATSCALAVRALKAMGTERVDYLVPNRFEYGYGLTPEIVAVALERNPDLLVTVDNGVSSIEGVAMARAAGVSVLVTDHHLPGARLPEADVIVNPNCPHDAFPSKNLAGVGVIFYVMAALRSRLRKANWFDKQGKPEPNLAVLLDLVALGTVADVVPLDRNNRILVYQGLQRIRSGHCCEGIKALTRVADRQRGRLVAADLGFAVAPRLNAAGRLEDMSLGIECLLTDDPGRAAELAGKLDSLNRERRRIEAEMQQQALGYLSELEPRQGELPSGLCLYRDAWHQGIIGILAARIRERYHRPVIAFAAAGNGMIKGSARSIPGVHIRDALEAVSRGVPGIVDKFGGHAMAAGLSLRLADYEVFSDAFDKEIRQRVNPEQLRGTINSDGPLEAVNLSMEFAGLLRDAGPWGQGFPEPVFDDTFKVINQRILGGKHLKLVLQPESGEGLLDAIAFNQAEDHESGGLGRIRAAYRLDINQFRGNLNLQLVIEQVESL
ncbi:MAG: single-stranded-DNA-specific exonuclease RecJ [Gammaproteobacteria bacterium]|nr:single-stranded-DNA-specific exonuclease RecJ [Gammaproteobacteria bacterium]